MSAAASTVRVQGPAPYDVVVGVDVLAEVRRMLPAGVQRVALCRPADLPAPAQQVIAELDGLEVLDLPLPDGEAAKTAQVAAACWGQLGQAGFTRSDAVLTVGGGATTDVGGFVAATWLRGVAVVHVPTTLLGMVDAAVGGKTGINTGAGKNLVGAFHEPAGVVCDLRLLDSLPREEVVSGLAEVVKCGFIADPEILRLVEADPEAAVDPGGPVLRELAERAIRVKAEVVSGDLRETAGSAAAAGSHPGRETLNYGHTMGHAVERATAYSLRHGEAVALGMVYVAELARLAGRLDDATAARHHDVLSRLGLPTTFDGASWEELHALMRVDKKARGSQLRFVVLDALARPSVLAAPDGAWLREAYEVMRGSR